MWWGITPGLDILEESKHAEGSGEEERKTVSALLIGQYDCRHALKTIAQKYRHQDQIDLKLYICEPLLENVARELLFITLALEPAQNLGLADKTHFFMDLYGNTLIRPAAHNYLSKVALRMLHMITNFNYAQEILPAVCLDNLKYKERDQLETIFKYWANKDDMFDILKAWDERVRKALGTRYDLRAGVFDWDYHMRYRPYGADLLGAYEYKKFREKGVSFYYEDTDPCIPNRTLASAIFSAGSKISSYGYMGDIQTGPYVTFGFNCEDKEMLTKVNGTMRKTCTEVTERNLMRIFHELQNNAPFIPTQVESNLTPTVVVQDSTEKLRIQRQDSRMLTENQTTGSRFKTVSDTYTSLALNKTEIIFLPTTALKDYSSKVHFENSFDIVTIPHNMVLNHFTPDVVKILKPGCKIVVDSPKYELSYRKEDLEKYKTDLEELMNSCNCSPLASYDFKKDEYVRYQVVK